MIHLHSIDILQEYFGDKVWNQDSPLKDSYVTNNEISILVQDQGTTHLDSEGFLRKSKIQVTSILKQKNPDNTFLAELDESVWIILLRMGELSHVDTVHRTLSTGVPHVDRDYISRVSRFEITYRIN